jgi:DNA-binding beta-propeller fold protein YncE
LATIAIAAGSILAASVSATPALASTPALLAVTTSSLPAATAGSNYSTALHASGGIKPYIWSLADGSLPAGLVLHPTGQIDGKPVGPAGTYDFTVEVTDQETPPALVTEAESIVVTVTPLTVTTMALPTAIAAVPYSATLAATGGVGPYNWSIPVGALPAGLKLHTATGVISGTPQVGGTFDFVAEVTDSEAEAQLVTASEAITVRVSGLVVTTGSILPTATGGLLYSVKLGASGGITPYQWSLSSGSLPAGLKLKPTGVISGTTNATGLASFTVQVTDAEAPAVVATENISLYVVDPLAVPATLPGGVVGTSYSASLQATGGLAPFSYAITSGSLPPGLSAQDNGMITGEITGNATADGVYSFAVAVTDSENPPATVAQAESITVTGGLIPITFNSGGLQEVINRSNSYDLVASGGTAPFTATVSSGAPPPGQSVDQTGNLSGTPTQAGQYSFTIEVTDSSSPQQVATQSVTVTVTNPVLLATTSLPNAIQGQPYSATLSAIGGAGAPYDFSLEVSALPDGLSLDSSTGIISGTPTSTTTDHLIFQIVDADSTIGFGSLVLTVVAPTTQDFGVGSQPDGIATDGTNMWVANGGDSTVTERSPTGKTLGTFPVGDGPVAIASDGTNMWVANDGDSTVTELSPAGATLGTFPVGAGPDAIASDGTNMWVANGGDSTVTELSPAGATLGTFSVGQSPDGIASDGTNMWVANFSDSTVTELSPTGKTLGTFSVGFGPAAIASDGTNMWVANGNDGSVTKLSPTGATLGTFPVGHNPDAIASDGTNMWVANELDDTVTELSPTGATLGTFPVGENPDAMASDGTNMWVALPAGTVTEFLTT